MLGIELDTQKNNIANSDEMIISTNTSNVTIMVIPTDEELVIAKDALEIISNT